MLDSLHRISGQEKFTIQPSALEIALPLLGEAEFETVRTLCSNARVIGDVMLLADALQGVDERAIRFAVTLAGRADKAGDAKLAESMLEKAASDLLGIEGHSQGSIAKNIAKGSKSWEWWTSRRDQANANTRRDFNQSCEQRFSSKGHTLALVGTYEGNIELHISGIGPCVWNRMGIRFGYRPD